MQEPKTQGIQGKHWGYREDTGNIRKTQAQGIHGKHWEYMENTGNTGKTLGSMLEHAIDIRNTWDNVGVM